MDYEEVEPLLTDSIRQLIVHQWQLAELDVGERSVSSHLFRYIADVFVNTAYHVDHEYNRQGSLTKHLSYGTGDDEGVKRIYPDIIVHRRDRDDANLVAIEVKKGAKNNSDDYDKIRALVSDDAYLYRWGILLALGIQGSSQTELIWVPRWQWLFLDTDSYELVTYRQSPVFLGEELERINTKGRELSQG